MSQGFPGSDAWGLLEEFEADPLGYGYLDLRKLLDAWGVTQELTSASRPGYRVYVHPDLPRFYFGYPERHELAPDTIRWICEALRELSRRLG